MQKQDFEDFLIANSQRPVGAPFQPEKERVELPQLRLPGGEAGQGPAGLLSVGFVCKTKEYVCDFGRFHSSLVSLENFLIRLASFGNFLSDSPHRSFRNVRLVLQTRNA